MSDKWRRPRRDPPRRPLRHEAHQRTRLQLLVATVPLPPRSRGQGPNLTTLFMKLPPN